MSYKVYKFTNKINGKVYIGVTKRSFKTRKYEHIKLSSKSKFHFHQAINKYGMTNFESEILTEVKTRKEGNQLEIDYITLNDSYINGYNMTEGGGNRGEFKQSDEAKRKLSIAHKGKKLSQSHKDNISKSNLGKTMSINSKNKISKALKGRKFSNKRKFLISKAKKGKQLKNENPSAIKVNIYNANDCLKFKCHGDFDKICKENGLPSKALRRSYYNEGKPIYQGRTTKKEVLIKNKEFIGWYAIKITP